jgi:hypothetical protein
LEFHCHPVFKNRYPEIINPKITGVQMKSSSSWLRLFDERRERKRGDASLTDVTCVLRVKLFFESTFIFCGIGL